MAAAYGLAQYGNADAQTGGDGRLEQGDVGPIQLFIAFAMDHLIDQSWRHMGCVAHRILVSGGVAVRVCGGRGLGGAACLRRIGHGAPLLDAPDL
ncbi:hypothetical protein [Loktanella fryxellensis]|uniref:hypothetical protein n=1 Tax=Loktanella fryxellensis TaxID=245187 RepID=UPI00115FBF2F|nr:hypothetical protein [Loktanella fryxellensis]